MLHVTTTPSVAYVTRVDSFDCGVMISASHNPFYDNGIKLINGRGEKMDDQTIADIEAYLDGNLAALGLEGDVPAARREELGEIVDYVSGRNRYVGYLISLAAHSYKNMRVGLDCANGSSWNIAKTVFEALGGEDVCHQRGAGRCEHQPRRGFHAYRRSAPLCGGKPLGRGLCL